MTRVTECNVKLGPTGTKTTNEWYVVLNKWSETVSIRLSRKDAHVPEKETKYSQQGYPYDVNAGTNATKYNESELTFSIPGAIALVRKIQQELNAELKSIQKENDSLRQRIDDLEEANSDLTYRLSDAEERMRDESYG